MEPILKRIICEMKSQNQLTTKLDIIHTKTAPRVSSECLF